MPRPRDTHRYELWQGHRKVYIGITNDPGRREGEHRAGGVDFDRMEIVGPAVTRDSALDWEQDALDTYMQGHGGETPEYND